MVLKASTTSMHGEGPGGDKDPCDMRQKEGKWSSLLSEAKFRLFILP